MLDIPCPNCVCIPICRCKDINRLLNECSLIFTYYYDFPIDDQTVNNKQSAIYRILKPLKWRPISPFVFINDKTGKVTRHLFDET
jgi:hypothetical protein